MNVLGKIALLLALLSFLLSVGFKIAIPGGIPFVGWGLAFAGFFLAFAIIINFKFLMSRLKSESLHFIGKSLLLIFLVLGILSTLNFIVYKKNFSIDVTENRIHSLSDLTQALIRALPEPLYFKYFHVGNSKVRGYEAKIKEGLQPYLALSSKVHFESYSIFQHPEKAKKFKTGNEESSLFLEYKGRIQRVSDITEPVVTNAILKLSKAPKKIYFLESHDERKVEDSSTFGVKGLVEQLERLHYQIDKLIDLSSIPKDTALIVMAGPRQVVTAEEQLKLKMYLEKGGALFLAVDPGEDHNLTDFLAEYGIGFENNFIFSNQAQAGQSDLLVLTHRGKIKHEVANTLVHGENPALFISSSLSIKESIDDSFKTSPILEHLPNSVGRIDISPDSKVTSQGVLNAAVVSEGQGDSYFRLAVVGDSDFMTNQFFARPGNFNFLLNVFTFLSKDEDLLKMKTPVAKTTYLIMTQTQMNLFFLFFVLPFSVLFFIVALFFKLRRYF